MKVNKGKYRLTFLCLANGVSLTTASASESGKDPNKCYYKGVAYAYGESVPVEDPCSASCFCSEAYEPDSP